MVEANFFLTKSIPEIEKKRLKDAIGKVKNPMNMLIRNF